MTLFFLFDIDTGGFLCHIHRQFLSRGGYCHLAITKVVAFVQHVHPMDNFGGRRISSLYLGKPNLH
jgi:hypothetical protein